MRLDVEDDSSDRNKRSPWRTRLVVLVVVLVTSLWLVIVAALAARLAALLS